MAQLLLRKNRGSESQCNQFNTPQSSGLHPPMSTGRPGPNREPEWNPKDASADRTRV